MCAVHLTLTLSSQVDPVRCAGDVHAGRLRHGGARGLSRLRNSHGSVISWDFIGFYGDFMV